MVYKIMQTRYRVFLESAIVALLMLLIGFAVGLYIESLRTDAIVKNVQAYELQALDLKLQNYYYQIMDSASCEQAIKQNFIFADDIYSKGLDLEKYEEANQISDSLRLEKKRYVLLKTELWLNSLLLKEKCGEPFDTIVYFYAGEPDNSALVARQKILSNVLSTVKEKHGNSIVLLPIAADLGLGAVDLQLRLHNITSLPSVLVNEKVLVEGFSGFVEIEKALNLSRAK